MSVIEPQATEPQLASLLGNLGDLIREARRKVLRAVDTTQVQTCWQIGRHIVEYEQQGARRAGYGKQLLATLASVLTAEFGKGFDSSNLRYMRLFYQAFPMCDALRHELSWTHYRLLTRVDSAEARQWYMTEAATQNWSTRALERQIGTLFYERLLLSQHLEALHLSTWPRSRTTCARKASHPVMKCWSWTSQPGPICPKASSRPWR